MRAGFSPVNSVFFKVRAVKQMTDDDILNVHRERNLNSSFGGPGAFDGKAGWTGALQSFKQFPNICTKKCRSS